MSRARLLLIAAWLTPVTILPAQMQPPSEAPRSAGEVYRVGRGVSAPVAAYHVEPDYSQEARKAGFQVRLACPWRWMNRGCPRT